MAAGVRSPVLEVGRDDQTEAVVFVHGNPGSCEDWSTLLSGVGSFARAVAMDMPGFGQADKPAGFDYSVTGYANHLTALLAELRVQRAHLVLHDFGGPWGLQWAVEHPDAFASTVLINTGVFPDHRWHLLARLWRTPVVGELFMATATRASVGLLLRQGNPRGLPLPFIDRMYADLDRGTRRAVLRLYRAEGRMGELAAAQTIALRPLQRPALVLWGRRDPYLPQTSAERQVDAFPGAQVHLLDGSGHWPFIDDPERTANVVLPWLRKIIGSADGS